LQPVAQRRRGGLAERHDALLAALAGDLDAAACELHAGLVQVAQLLGAQAAAVEELERRPVAQQERLLVRAPPVQKRPALAPPPSRAAGGAGGGRPRRGPTSSRAGPAPPSREATQP